jgi:seryl-tRNA synthetase
VRLKNYLCENQKFMLQLQVLRQDPQSVKKRLTIKNFNDAHLVDEIILLDDERKKLQLESDNILSKLNISSKEIGQLMAKGQRQEAETKKKEVSLLKESLLKQKNN